MPLRIRFIVWRRGGPKGRERRAERQLLRSDEMRHWSQLARRQKARRTLSIALLGIRERSDQTKQGAEDQPALVASALTGVVVALLLFVVVEAIAALLNHFLHWGSLFRPVSSSNYETFVGAAVGAQATFLALFFTTVGVIASTAYARVPGEIRQLFVRERTSLIYVWNVAVALLVGLALLTMPLVAHRWPHGLTVLLSPS